jgi:hypothetical protein
VAILARPMEVKMRSPTVTFSPDDTIKEFIGKAVGSSNQDIMIGSEILFAAGLASRELTLFNGWLTIHFLATAGLMAKPRGLGDV